MSRAHTVLLLTPEYARDAAGESCLSHLIAASSLLLIKRIHILRSVKPENGGGSHCRLLTLYAVN